MKLLALVVAVAIAPPAHAAERGAVTGVGLGFFALSLTTFGLGVGTLLAANDASRTLNAYPMDLPASEAGAFVITRDRLVANSAVSIVSFVVGALSLGAGIVCLVVDTPAASATVRFMPLPQGGAFSVSVRF